MPALRNLICCNLNIFPDIGAWRCLETLHCRYFTSSLDVNLSHVSRCSSTLHHLEVLTHVDTLQHSSLLLWAVLIAHMGRHLRDIELQNIHLDPNGWRIVGRDLSPTLHTLSLTDCRLDSACFTILTHHFPRLVRFQLEENTYVANFTGECLRSLRQWEHLTHLQWSVPALDDTRLVEIASSCPSSLVSLRLSSRTSLYNRSMYEITAVGIVKAARLFPTPLQHWYLARNRPDLDTTARTILYNLGCTLHFE